MRALLLLATLAITLPGCSLYMVAHRPPVLASPPHEVTQMEMRKRLGTPVATRHLADGRMMEEYRVDPDIRHRGSKVPTLATYAAMNLIILGIPELWLWPTELVYQSRFKHYRVFYDPDGRVQEIEPVDREGRPYPKTVAQRE